MLVMIWLLGCLINGLRRDRDIAEICFSRKAGPTLYAIEERRWSGLIVDYLDSCGRGRLVG
jgi:hypothetical protein